MESDMMGGGLLMELWTDGFEGCGLDLEVVRSVGWIKKKATHLWVGGLGDGGGLRSTISIEGEELLRVVLNPCLTDELVTYQPEHPWVGFHLGNLLCHSEWDLYLRESLIGGLDCLPESHCLGGPPDHLMGLGLVHPIVEACLSICLVHLSSVEVNLFPVHHCIWRTYSHHD